MQKIEGCVRFVFYCLFGCLHYLFCLEKKSGMWKILLLYKFFHWTGFSLVINKFSMLLAVMWRVSAEIIKSNKSFEFLFFPSVSLPTVLFYKSQWAHTNFLRLLVQLYWINIKKKKNCIRTLSKWQYLMQMNILLPLFT